MVYRDVFIRELATDIRRAWIVIVIGLIASMVATYYFITSAMSLTSLLKQALGQNSKQSLLGDLNDPSQDDFAPLARPEDMPVDVSTAFAKTLQTRAMDKNIASFNAQVTEICSGRKDDPACKIDPGLGGGTAAAFDPLQD